MKNKISSILLLLLLPIIAEAHPGHDHYQDNPVLHFFTSPLHFIYIFILLLAILCVKKIKVREAFKKGKK